MKTQTLEADLNNWQSVMRLLIRQLEGYRSPSKPKDRAEHLELDILGYKEILNSNCVENYNSLLELKHREFTNDDPKTFCNNLEIVNYLKGIGKWKQNAKP